ncbi:hypothetical protein ACS0TY_032473 [Phlomoides rotata]
MTLTSLAASAPTTKDAISSFHSLKLATLQQWSKALGILRFVLMPCCTLLLFFSPIKPYRSFAGLLYRRREIAAVVEGRREIAVVVEGFRDFKPKALNLAINIVDTPVATKLPVDPSPRLYLVMDGVGCEDKFVFLHSNGVNRINHKGCISLCYMQWLAEIPQGNGMME